MKKLNVIVLLGGNSSEREVSINSGTAIYKTIEKIHNVHLSYLDSDLSSGLGELGSPDLVFNSLHGGYGENGDLQAILELLKIKYTGSQPLACSIAMSKHQTKLIAMENNIPTASWLILNCKKNDKVEKVYSSMDKISYPLVVKPDNEGSTVGLSIIENDLQLGAALTLAIEYSQYIMVEKFISGREITVGIIGDKALPIVEIFSTNSTYDYEAKYSSGKSTYHCPADISEKLTKTIQKAALKIHELLGCRHYSRVDFRLNEDNDFFLLEINTHPGMTSTSLLPKAAEAADITFNELVLAIIDEAMKD